MIKSFEIFFHIEYNSFVNKKDNEKHDFQLYNIIF